MAETTDPKPALFISRTAALPNQQGIQVNVQWNDGETWAQLCEKMDMSHDTIERERARSVVPALELEIEKQRKQLEQLLDQVTTLQKKRSNGETLRSTEDQALENARNNIKVLRGIIEDFGAQIDKAEKRFKELTERAT